MQNETTLELKTEGKAEGAVKRSLRDRLLSVLEETEHDGTDEIHIIMTHDDLDHVISCLSSGLADTVLDMLSVDYIKRFKAEFTQTRLRHDSLRRLVNRIEVSRLLQSEEPPHDCPLSLLVDQMRVMDAYLRILEERALIEGIPL